MKKDKFDKNTFINQLVGQSSTNLQSFSQLTPEEIAWNCLSDLKLVMDPIRWIEAFNLAKGYSYSYKSESVVKNSQMVASDHYKAEIRLTVKKKDLGKHLGKQVIDDAVKIWMADSSDEYLKKIRTDMQFQPSSDDLVADWILAATGVINPNDVAVMKHFLWQVRRKIMNMPVDHHIMPVLYGKSGGGKSVAVRGLLKPIEDLSTNMDMAIFEDQFKMRVFTRKYVMFFDEMAHSDRANVDKLKNVITAEEIEYRKMHSEDMVKGPQCCTFIGCSNDQVIDKIYDPTSARRYWQLNCADTLDWQKINSLDYVALWKSVDESQPSPILGRLQEISEVQNNVLRNRSMVEEWLLSEVVVSQGASTPSSTLFEHFKLWCRHQNVQQVPTGMKFYRNLDSALKQVGWNVTSQHTAKGTMWPLKVKRNLNIQDGTHEFLWSVQAQASADDDTKDK